MPPDSTTVVENIHHASHLKDKVAEMLGSLFVAILAAFVRVIFSKGATPKQSLATFLGGVALAMLAGWLIQDIAWLKLYSNGIVAVCALAGREVAENLPKMVPAMLRAAISAILKTEVKKPDDIPDNPVDS